MLVWIGKNPRVWCKRRYGFQRFGYTAVPKSLGSTYTPGASRCVFMHGGVFILSKFLTFLNRHGRSGPRRLKTYNCATTLYFVIVLARVGPCCLDRISVRHCLHHRTHCEIETFKVATLKEHVKSPSRPEGHCWNIFLSSLNTWKRR